MIGWVPRRAVHREPHDIRRDGFMRTNQPDAAADAAATS